MWPIKKFPLGNTTKFLTFKHETGRAGSWQPEFWNSLFPLPVGWICSRYVKPFRLLATNQLISIAVFFSKQRRVSWLSKKFSELPDHTDLRATESRPNPHRPARAPATSLRWLKQWTSSDFSSNHHPWKTRSVPVTVDTLLGLKQLCEPCLLHTHTHTQTHTFLIDTLGPEGDLNVETINIYF